MLIYETSTLNVSWYTKVIGGKRIKYLNGCKRDVLCDFKEENSFGLFIKIGFSLMAFRTMPDVL